MLSSTSCTDKWSFLLPHVFHGPPLFSRFNFNTGARNSHTPNRTWALSSLAGRGKKVTQSDPGSPYELIHMRATDLATVYETKTQEKNKKQLKLPPRSAGARAGSTCKSKTRRKKGQGKHKANWITAVQGSLSLIKQI